MPESMMPPVWIEQTTCRLQVGKSAKWAWSGKSERQANQICATARGQRPGPCKS